MTINTTLLQALAANLKELADAIDRIAKSLDSGKTVPPEKKKPVKTILRKAVVKKAQSKKPPKKPTQTEIVLKTINRARLPLNTATLKKRTGLDTRAINNAVYRLKKDNMIKSPAKGVYTKI